MTAQKLSLKAINRQSNLEDLSHGDWVEVSGIGDSSRHERGRVLLVSKDGDQHYAGIVFRSILQSVSVRAYSSGLTGIREQGRIIYDVTSPLFDLYNCWLSEPTEEART